jgi:hypothetical protein
VIESGEFPESSSALCDLVRGWRDCFVGAPEEAPSAEVQRVWQLIFAETVSMVALAFKDQGFQEEQEWRLVYRKSEIIPDDGVNLPIHFRPRNGLTLPFSKIRFDKYIVSTPSERPIIDIVMGRRNYSNIAGFALEKFLISLGDWHEEIHIQYSRIPLRSWST